MKAKHAKQRSVFASRGGLEILGAGKAAVKYELWWRRNAVLEGVGFDMKQLSRRWWASFSFSAAGNSVNYNYK